MNIVFAGQRCRRISLLDWEVANLRHDRLAFGREHPVDEGLDVT
jgi:hypothetical protein